MSRGWQILAFPLILPWREEFWTLPLYVPHLEVGVASGWPPSFPVKTRPLPPEAMTPLPDLRHYHTGELTQQQAYRAYLEAREEVEDILRELQGLPPRETPEAPVEAQAVALAWHLERMEAEQEAQLTLVDKGHTWLAEILSPEPWEETPSFGSVPGLKEMVDPDMARLRYSLWHRELAAGLQGPWAPFLLSRTSRAIFGALKGWPRWTRITKATVNLPGVNSEEAWRQVGPPPWQENFIQELEAILKAADQGAQRLAEHLPRFQRFVAEVILTSWSGPPQIRWELEIWARDPEEEDFGPVLCWGGVNADILPG